MVADARHPDQGSGGKNERENLGLAKGHTLEHQQLAQEVAQRNDVSPDSYVVNGADVEVVGRVETNDTGEESPSSKEACRKGCDLVGTVLPGRCMYELIHGIIGVEPLRRRWKLWVTNEAGVIHPPCVVQGY